MTVGGLVALTAIVVTFQTLLFIKNPDKGQKHFLTMCAQITGRDEKGHF